MPASSLSMAMHLGRPEPSGRDIDFTCAGQRRINEECKRPADDAL